MARNLFLTAIIAKFKFIESSAVNETATTTRTKIEIDLMFVETKGLNLNARATKVIRK